MARRITSYRIFYNDRGKIGATIFSGGKKAMQNRIKSLRKGSNVKWSIRSFRKNAWIPKK